MPDFENKHLPDAKLTSISDSDAFNQSDASAPDRDPFEEICSEFADRHRNGELPSIEEYAQAYPDLASEIRELFPTIAAMEQLKERKAPGPKPTLGGLPLEQLGDFRILGEIGRGGMGVVYEAEQVSLGRHVAVKVLPKQALLDERHLRRFEREAQTAAKLHHTNIVPVFGVGQQDGYHYIVMQFIPGVGLDEILVALRSMVLKEDARRFAMDSSSRASHANHNAQALLDGNFSKHVASSVATSFTKSRSSGTQAITGQAATLDLMTTRTAPLSGGSEDSDSEPKSLDADHSAQLATLDNTFYESIANIGKQVADALAYAHEQGTLHRDIKPGNLLLDSTGTVWVADFGLAKLAEHDNVSRTGDLVGTLSYMPPESFSGDTDARGDIYALGLTMYEMLAMRPAYFGRDRGKMVKQITEGELPRLGKLNPHIPRDLETIVLKAVAHRPEDRYATARELEEDLQSYLDDMPIKARRMSPPEQFVRWCRKNRLVAGLAASVLTLLVITSVTFRFQRDIAQTARLDAQTNADVAAKNADIARAAQKNAQDSADEARENLKQAEENADEAQRNANVAMSAVISIFDLFAGPDKLPLSADDSLKATELDSEVTVEEDLAGFSATESVAATVAAPPVNEETAKRLEALLEEVLPIIEQADEDAFSLVFPDLILRVGKLYAKLGKHDDASQSFRAAIEKYSDLTIKYNDPENRDSPQAARAIVGLVMSHNELGEVSKMLGEADEANLNYEESLSLLDSHSALLQNSSRAKYEHARTLFLMSVRFDRPGGRPPMNGGPPGASRGERERSRRGGGPVAEQREVREREPTGRGGGRGRGRGGRGAGEERLAKEKSGLLKAIEILNDLVRDEDNPEYRYLLARCHMGLSSVSPPHLRMKSVDDAIHLLDQLVIDEPNVVDYQFELAVAKLRSQDSPFRMSGRDKSIDIQIVREAVQILDRVTAQNPDVAHYAVAHAIGAVRLTELLERRANGLKRITPKEADELIDEASKVAEIASTAMSRVKERYPDQHSTLTRILPSAHEFAVTHGHVLAKHQENDRAAKIFQTEIDRIEASAEIRGDTNRQLAKLRIDLGRSLRLAGRVAEGETELRKSLDSLQRLVDTLSKPGRDNRGRGRGFEIDEAIELLATAQFELGDAKAALETIESAAAKQIEQIQRNNPKSKPSDFDALRANLQLSKWLRAIHLDDRADKIISESHPVLLDSLDDVDAEIDFRTFMFLNYVREELEELGQDKEAQELATKMRALFEARNPRNERPSVGPNRPGPPPPNE